MRLAPLALLFASAGVAQAATVYAPQAPYQPMHTAVYTPPQVEQIAPRTVVHPSGRVEHIPGSVVMTAPQVRVSRLDPNRSYGDTSAYQQTVYTPTGSWSSTVYEQPEPVHHRPERPRYQPVHQPPAYYPPQPPVVVQPVYPQPVYAPPPCPPPVVYYPQPVYCPPPAVVVPPPCPPRPCDTVSSVTWSRHGWRSNYSVRIGVGFNGCD
jgi:hypothetical protein